MNHTTLPCSDDQLHVLLHGDEHDEDFQVATEHVQWCSHCQSRLSELAADRDEWAEAQRSLAVDEEERQIEDEQAERSWSATGHRRPPRQWTESMTRQLLDPPSHPEMLGRLGRYEIERLIGIGGMGVVFKGFDSELNRPVAAKVLAPHLASSGAARKRFSREARAAAAVVDEHVVAIHNVESDGESPFLVMQYVAGESLQVRLDRSGPLDVCEILRIGMQTAKGLSAAHAQGLIHRDVKPSNILLEEGVDRALLTDFGLARACDDASLTRSGHHPGTPQFMSPEQARGDTVDQRSDLFSLGSVLYTMCTGRPPFRAETSYGILRRITDTEPRPIREINPEIPDWLCAIIDKLMAKRPEDRFSSVEEVAELLEDCLAHVQQPSAVPLPWRKLPACDDSARQAGSLPHGRKPWANAQRLIRSRHFKLIAAAAFTFALVFAGILIVLELNKGTLTIESEADNVPIRIMQDDKVVEQLTVSKSGESVRVAAGKYVVEIEGGADGIAVENGTVELQRRGVWLVRIAQRPTRLSAGAESEDASIPGNSSAALPPRTLKEVVATYLTEVDAIKTLEAAYSVIQRDVRDGKQSVLQRGVFAMGDGKLAARTHEQHAVFDGSKTIYRLGSGPLLTAKFNASLFGNHWDHPALLFHRMHVPELTPLDVILRDAIGPQRFGTATLKQSRVHGEPCYVIEGAYDRTKLNQAEGKPPILWRYRIHLKPDEGMQLVKLESFDVGQNIPVGIVEITETLQRGEVRIPMSGVYHSYYYWRENGQLKADRVYENLIQLDKTTLKVNEEIDRNVFDVGREGAVRARGVLDDLPPPTPLVEAEATEVETVPRTVDFSMPVDPSRIDGAVEGAVETPLEDVVYFILGAKVEPAPPSALETTGFTRGLRIVEIFPLGPADLANLRVGNVIVKIDETPIGNLEDVEAAWVEGQGKESRMLNVVALRGRRVVPFCVTWPQSPNTPRLGHILKRFADDTVVISLGSNHGIGTGNTLMVFTNETEQVDSKSLGTIVTSVVEAARSTARIIHESEESPMRAGDRVPNSAIVPEAEKVPGTDGTVVPAQGESGNLQSNWDAAENEIQQLVKQVDEITNRADRLSNAAATEPPQSDRDAKDRPELTYDEHIKLFTPNSFTEGWMTSVSDVPGFENRTVRVVFVTDGRDDRPTEGQLQLYDEIRRRGKEVAAEVRRVLSDFKRAENDPADIGKMTDILITIDKTETGQPRPWSFACHIPGGLVPNGYEIFVAEFDQWDMSVAF